MNLRILRGYSPPAIHVVVRVHIGTGETKGRRCDDDVEDMPGNFNQLRT
jgi:hypothetical protein